MTCLFCKIIAGEIPAKIQYQDDNVIAFADINPQAPVHTLIVPRTHVATLNELSIETASVIGYMTNAASKIAKEFGIDQDGYRLVMNCNSGAGQTVFHIHMHLLGGRVMTWPPG